MANMNRLMHILAVTAIVFAGGPSAFAQGGYTVSGTVTDDLGPVIGATIIDLPLILPVCAVISGGTLPVVGTVGVLDMPACLLIGAVTCIPTLITKKFARWQGFLLLGLYAVYMVLTVFFGDAVLALVK